MTAIPLALVGIGKIARDQHLPALARSRDFTLVGAVSHSATDLNVPVLASIAELKQARPDVAAVSICTPPLGRLGLVGEALALGLHVMIEKPPAATISEAERMIDVARAAGRTLFVTWHSREAAGVEAARQWLARRQLRSARVRWLEDVRVWHPGQEWIWQPGIGVFDPGINAFSILTRVIGRTLIVSRATLDLPNNRRAPVAAKIELLDDSGARIDVDFSLDQRGPQRWTIEFESSDGLATLSDGGAMLTINGAPQRMESEGEYPRLYSRFAELIAANDSDTDLSPLRLIADSFMLGEQRDVGAFEWT